GPSASVDNRVAAMSGTTGKLIKDSGVLITSLPRVDAAQSFSQAEKVLMAANIGMGYVQIGGRVSFTNSAAVAWTDLSEYSELQLEFSAIGNAACNLGLQASVDNGASWLSGANDYAYKTIFSNGTAIVTTEVATVNRFPVVGLSLANIMDASAAISRFNKIQTKQILSDAAFFDGSNSKYSISNTSGYFNAGVANALRLISTTGTWTGNATLWGRKG
ncbi:hypothetical protein, partial [Shinella sp.]|uniref:hypothetical protein n=1 Tax=Shinella sp. TaxID=1870904 RepID=UPI0028A584E4